LRARPARGTITGVSYRLGVLTLVAMTVVWGTTFAITKGTLDSISVPLLLAVRFSFAALCFAWVPFDRRAVVPALVLGLVAFVGFATQTWGLTITTASKSAFITGLSVILTPLVARAFYGYQPPPRLLVAGVLSVAGLGLLTLHGGADGPNAGDLLTLVTALTYALYIVYLGQVAGRVSGMALAGLQHVPLAVLAWIWAAPDVASLASVPWTAYLAIAYLGVVASAVVAVGQVYAQRVVPAAVAALIFVLEPLFASLFAMAVLGESLGVAGWIGGAMVVAAMAIAEVRPRRLPRGGASAS
jgi:drug/metabolite transporter (DMT)-like permease